MWSPINAKDSPETPPPHHRDNSALLNVLVVDDSAMNASPGVRPFGKAADSASTWRRPVHRHGQMKKFPPDVILLDLENCPAWMA